MIEMRNSMAIEFRARADQKICGARPLQKMSA